MAGKGSEVGGRFEELREILDRVVLADQMGVCLDTCHVSDGGYDIIHNLDGVLTEFDRVIGLHRLKAVHLERQPESSTGSPQGPARAHRRRAPSGWQALGRVVRHPALRDLPLCPGDPQLSCRATPWEIALLRAQAEA